MPGVVTTATSSIRTCQWRSLIGKPRPEATDAESVTGRSIATLQTLQRDDLCEGSIERREVIRAQKIAIEESSCSILNGAG
jgi:hypothetical protein